MFRRKKKVDVDFTKFVIQGLRGSGKSVLLHFLSRGELLTEYYMNSDVDLETFSFNGVELTGWALGWRHKMRQLFRLNYYHTSGLIYIIDSADEENMDEVFDEMNEFIFQEELLEGSMVMVLANKQDLEDAVGPHEIEARLRKRCKIKNGITVFVMPCSLTKNTGLDLAMTRFVRQMNFKKEGKLPVGFLPLAWETEDHVEWEAANHKPPKKDASGDGVLHKLKKAVLKDPFKAVKAFITH